MIVGATSSLKRSIKLGEKFMLSNLRTHCVIVLSMIVLTLTGCDCFRNGQQLVDLNRPCGSRRAQTLPALENDITAKQAKELLDRRAGYIYLDVRTIKEFADGHVPGAINIPVMQFDSKTQRMAMNDDFLASVKKEIPKTSHIIVGCKSGGRSARSQKIMHTAGYKNVANMLGGFHGKKNKAGEIIYPGWSMMGYPIERENVNDRGLAYLDIQQLATQ